MAADAIVFLAIKTLGDYLTKESKFLFGVEDQVKHLQTELHRIRGFLKDADAKQHKSQTICNFVAEITEAAYDAEDVLEAYLLKVASRRGEGGRNFANRYACIFEETIVVRKIGSEIEAINSRLSNIRESLKIYGIQELHDLPASTSLEERQRENRETFPHVVERDLIGLEHNVENLLMNLEHVQVISILGMGGLGKTTLAKQIYNHKQVRDRFDHFAWACISQQCQRRYVWEGILSCLSLGDDMDRITKLRDQDLVIELHQVMANSKCLVVIDDIWSVEAWDSLKDAFPYETNTKIIITTRNYDVALYSHLGRQGFLHEPECLSKDQSWELFYNIAFPKTRVQLEDIEANKRKEKLGRQMVEKCSGLPLAIKVLGGLLASKSKFNQWQIVNNDLKSYFTKGDPYGKTYSPVSYVLSLSYDDLSPELKQCFLHMSTFPEDWEIRVGRLCNYWVAEGFITSVQPQDGDTTLEDIANGYLNELIQRSMVTVGHKDREGFKLITCRLHDLMRDLCLLKAEHTSFLQVINPQNSGDVQSSSSTSKFRRVAVYLHQIEGENILCQNHITVNHQIRSIIYFNRSIGHISNVIWIIQQLSFNKLKLLRVLDLEGGQFEGGKLPKNVGNLIHLRYLSLRNSNVTKLPSSLGNLTLLLTLDLWISDGEVHVPDVLCKMQSLRHLHLPNICDAKTKLSLGNLIHLQTLVNFQVGPCDLNDILNMKKLKILRSYWSSRSKRTTVPASIGSGLKNLQTLLLGTNRESNLNPPLQPIDVTQLIPSFTNLAQLDLILRIEKLPNILPRDITSICLYSCELEDDPMLILEKLLNLKFVVLGRNSFVGRKMICSAQGFPKLKELSLKSLIELEEWLVEEGAMLNLCTLKVSGCRNLTLLPDELQSIATLTNMTVEDMP